MAEKSSSLIKGCLQRDYEERFLRDLIHQRSAMWSDQACKKLAGMAHRQPVSALRQPSHILKVMRFIAAERGAGLVKMYRSAKPTASPATVAMRVIDELAALRVVEEILLRLMPPPHQVFVLMAELLQKWAVTADKPQFFQTNKESLVTEYAKTYGLYERSWALP